MPKFADNLLYGVGAQELTSDLNIPRMRKERNERLIKIMKKHNCSAMLVSGGDNVRYVAATTAQSLPAGLSYALITVDGVIHVWDFPGDVDLVRESCDWIPQENIHVAHYWHGGAPGKACTEYNAKIYAQDMKEILAKAGLLGEKIAVAGVDGISIAALAEAGIETYSGHWIMQEARAVKTRDEQVCAKTVAAIADVGFWAIQEALKPGVRDIDVQAAAMAAMTKAGAVVTPNTIVVFSGPHGYPRGIPNTDRIIRPGDLVYVDIAGIKYMGYNSCIYRTYKVGCQPTAQEKSWMDRVLEKQNKAIEAIKPGNTSADVAACFSPCDELGYPTELDCLSMDICHGIGLISYEEPIINRLDSFNYPQELLPGMVIAVETIYGEKGVGGARLEDMVIVTEDGCEIIDRTPRDHILVTHSYD